MQPSFDSYAHLLWWHPLDLWPVRQRLGTLRVGAVWLAVSGFSVLAGLWSTNWNAIGLRFGPINVGITFYPPLALCVLLTLWLGPFWGIVPAYLTSLILAIHNGMPLATSALFGLATPITLMVLWSSMVMLEVSPGLTTWPDVVRFMFLSLVAAGSSSVGALIWNSYNDLQFVKAQAVWEGWVLGDFLQIVLIVGPLLFLFHRRVQRWLLSQVKAEPRRTLKTRFYIAVFLLVFAIMAAVGSMGARLFMQSLKVGYAEGGSAFSMLDQTLREAAFFIAVYGVVFLAGVILFSSTLGSQLERHVRDIAERKRIHEEREKIIAQLQEALSKVKLLSGMLPICANCKKVRDDRGYWNQIEEYVRKHSEAEFSHAICPECMKKLYPEFNAEGKTNVMQPPE